MTLLNKPRGTQDIYPPRSLIYQKIQQIIAKILHNNNYYPIIFPTFESKDLFTSSLGYDTDVVHKEMYVFQDRKGRELALRPEGTAGVARLVCQNKLVQVGYPLKLYYWANMFRYERPQKGRYREFWQLGVELVNAQGIIADYQILKLVYDILKVLGINNFTFHLNYLGDNETKERYKKKLKSFIDKNSPDLCEDCQRRYKTNPFRILDCFLCKNKFGFPSYQSVWNDQEQEYINKLNQFLNKSGLPCQYNHYLVRGLDYYTGLVFEIDLETEKAILGGGRYDNLYKKIGDIDLPAVGFAIGIERLIEYLEKVKLLEINKQIDVFFLATEPEVYDDILFWKEYLVKHSLVIDYNLEIRKNKSLAQIIEYYQPRLLVLLEKAKKTDGKILIKDCQGEKKKEFLVEKEEIMDWICSYFKI